MADFCTCTSRATVGHLISTRRALLLGFLLDPVDGFGQEIDDRQAQLGVGDLHALLVEVLAHLAENVLVTLLGKIRLAYRAYVILKRRPGKPQLRPCPFAKQLVAARLGLEPKLLIHRKFLLERLLAFVE